MFILLFPIQVAAIVEDAKRELHQQDKAMASDVGLASYDWSKAKTGARPLDLHRLVKAPARLQWAIVRAWAAALRAEDVTQEPDADLIADITAKLGQVRRRLLKAGLRETRQKESA